MRNEQRKPDDTCIDHENWLRLASDYGEIPLTDEVNERLIRLSQYESLCLLAAGKAHDFRNLLSIVRGNISLSKMKYYDHPQLLKWLEDAETALAQAYSLANQLMNMGKGNYHGKKVIHVREFLQRTSEVTFSAYDVIPVFEISDDLWDVFIDEGQIQQVIVNLLVNAVQAMHNCGTVWIGAVNEEIKENNGYLASGMYVKITVRDEGGGIPEAYWGDLFQPFFTTKLKGTGLGLSTSNAIINQHQGYMNFVCDHKGTTFMVFLPAVKVRNQYFAESYQHYARDLADK